MHSSVATVPFLCCCHLSLSSASSWISTNCTPCRNSNHHGHIFFLLDAIFQFSLPGLKKLYFSFPCLFLKIGSLYWSTEEFCCPFAYIGVFIMYVRLVIYKQSYLLSTLCVINTAYFALQMFSRALDLSWNYTFAFPLQNWNILLVIPEW